MKYKKSKIYFIVIAISLFLWNSTITEANTVVNQDFINKTTFGVNYNLNPRIIPGRNEAVYIINPDTSLYFFEPDENYVYSHRLYHENNDEFYSKVRATPYNLKQNGTFYADTFCLSDAKAGAQEGSGVIYYDNGSSEEALARDIGMTEILSNGFQTGTLESYKNLNSANFYLATKMALKLFYVGLYGHGDLSNTVVFDQASIYIAIDDLDYVTKKSGRLTSEEQAIYDAYLIIAKDLAASGSITVKSGASNNTYLVAYKEFLVEKMVEVVCSRTTNCTSTDIEWTKNLFIIENGSTFFNYGREYLMNLDNYPNYQNYINRVKSTNPSDPTYSDKNDGFIDVVEGGYIDVTMELYHKGLIASAEYIESGTHGTKSSITYYERNSTSNDDGGETTFGFKLNNYTEENTFSNFTINLSEDKNLGYEHFYRIVYKNGTSTSFTYLGRGNTIYLSNVMNSQASNISNIDSIEVKTEYSYLNAEEECESPIMNTNFAYTSNSKEVHYLRVGEYSQEYVFLVPASDQLDKTGSITKKMEFCPDNCKNQITIPNTCVNPYSTSTTEDDWTDYDSTDTYDVEDPDEIMSCIVSVPTIETNNNTSTVTWSDRKDDAGNTYELHDAGFSSAGVSFVKNKYCQVSCKEEYSLIFPAIRDINSGRYFNIDSDINGTKSCYTSQIQIGVFKEDIISQQQEIIRLMNKYNSYAKASLTKDGNHRCPDEAGGFTTPPKHVTTGTYTSYSGTFDEFGDITFETDNEDVVNESTSCSTDYESLQESINNIAASTSTELGSAIDAYNTMMKNYSDCTKWEVDYEITTVLEYSYDTPYFTQADKINDADIMEKVDEEVTENIYYCQGVVNEEYTECNGKEFDDTNLTANTEKVLHIDCNTTNYTCKTIEKTVPNVAYKTQSINEVANYETKRVYHSLVPSGNIVITDKDDINTEYITVDGLPAEILPTGSNAYYTYKIKIDDLGEYYHNNEKGRLLDSNTNNNEANDNSVDDSTVNLSASNCLETYRSTSWIAANDKNYSYTIELKSIDSTIYEGSKITNIDFFGNSDYQIYLDERDKKVGLLEEDEESKITEITAERFKISSLKSGDFKATASDIIEINGKYYVDINIEIIDISGIQPHSYEGAANDEVYFVPFTFDIEYPDSVCENNVFTSEYVCYAPINCPDCEFVTEENCPDCDFNPGGNFPSTEPYCPTCQFDVTVDIMYRTYTPDAFNPNNRVLGYNWNYNYTSNTNYGFVSLKAQETLGVDKNGNQVNETGIISKGNKVYAEDPYLTVTLDPALSSEIKSHNSSKEVEEAGGGYLDNSLDCKTVTLPSGTYENLLCYSTALDKWIESDVHKDKFQFSEEITRTYNDNKTIVVSKSNDSNGIYESKDGYWSLFTTNIKAQNETTIGGPAWK